MRVRYGYKINLENGSVKFVVDSHVNQEANLLKKYKEIGATEVELHQRVKTGFRMNLETGELEETGLHYNKKVATQSN